jgi:hypothetical protein
MASDLKDLLTLKRKVEDLKREADKASGAFEQNMKRLKDEHGCDTLEEAEKLLKKKKREAEEAGTSFETSLAEFNKKWEGKL